MLSRNLFFALLLMPAIFAPMGSQNINFQASIEVAAVANLHLTGFSAAPASVAQGGSVNFYLTILSVGNVVSDFTAHVFVYNSGGTLVDTVNFTTSTISAGEEQVLVKSWSTGSLAPGTYSIYANATYNSSTTNTMSTSFTIAQQGGGGGTGPYVPSPGVIIPILPAPPEVKLPLTALAIPHLKVLRLSPYREMLPGESALISPMVENPTDSLVSFNISLMGPGAYFASPVQNMLLSPGEKRTVPMTIKIPASMPRGYYAFYVNLSAGGAEISYPAVIRVVHSYSLGEPIVKRQLSLDYDRNETVVALTLTNTGSEPLPYVQLYDRLPDSILPLASMISFTSKPTKMISDGRGAGKTGTVRWDLEGIMPYESRTIYYRVPLLLNDMSQYPGWNLAQLVTIRQGSPGEILLQDTRTPNILPGDKGEIGIKLFNAGSLGRDIDIFILGPSGWKIKPNSLTTTLPSREASDLTFEVEPPAFADPGSYGFTLRLKYGETIVDRQLFVYVYKPMVELFAPPITDQLVAWIGSNLGAMLVALLALVLVLIGAVVAFNSMNSPHYSRERVRSLKAIEDMLEQKEK